MISDRDGRGQRHVPAAADQQPADHGAQRYDVHERGVVARDAVGDADVDGRTECSAASISRTISASSVSPALAVTLRVSGPVRLSGAGKARAADPDRLAARLSPVSIDLSMSLAPAVTHAVDRDAFAGGDLDAYRRERCRRSGRGRPSRRRAIRIALRAEQRHQLGRGGARDVAHPVVEKAADEQEEEERRPRHRNRRAVRRSRSRRGSSRRRAGRRSMIGTSMLSAPARDAAECRAEEGRPA